MTCTEKSAGTFNEDQLEIIHTDQAIAKPLAQLIDTDTVYTNSGYDIGKEGATQEMGKDQGELLRPPETDDYELFKKSLKSFVQGTGRNSQGGQTRPDHLPPSKPPSKPPGSPESPNSGSYTLDTLSPKKE